MIRKSFVRKSCHYLCRASGIAFILSPGLTYAEVVCSGWNNAITETASLNLPSRIDLPLNSAPGTVIATGKAQLPPALACRDTLSGTEIKNTNWTWMNQGFDSGTGSLNIMPGIGLKLSWVPLVSPASPGSLLSDRASQDTEGFNWSELNWSLIRTATVIGPEQNVALPFNGEGTLVLPDNTTRRLQIQQRSPVRLSTSCSLSTDKSVIYLPDTDTNALIKNGAGESRSLMAYVTCPANTSVNSTLTLSTLQTEETDNSLIGNLGEAKGIAIEVMDNNGKRVSALNGVIEIPGFTQVSAAVPGASSPVNVRIVHLPGQNLQAGTVRATFTLTLNVN